MNIKLLILAAARTIQTKVKIFLSGKILRYGEGLHIGARSKIWAPQHVQIGKQVYIGKDVHIEANCKIGNYCLIANRVAIIGRHDHDFSRVGFPMRFTPWIGSDRFPSQYRNEDVDIKDDVWIGYGVIVLTGVTIERGSVIAAGSVVTSNIPAYSIAAGIPAKIVGQRFKDKATIDMHETSILNGKFIFSEKGYDHFINEPFLPNSGITQ